VAVRQGEDARGQVAVRQVEGGMEAGDERRVRQRGGQDGRGQVPVRQGEDGRGQVAVRQVEGGMEAGDERRGTAVRQEEGGGRTGGRGTEKGRWGRDGTGRHGRRER
jgi:hypothetical protein